MLQRLHSLRRCTITTPFHHLSILWSAPKLFMQRMYIILHNRFLETCIAKFYIYTLRLSFRAQQSMQGTSCAQEVIMLHSWPLHNGHDAWLQGLKLRASDMRLQACGRKKAKACCLILC